MRLETDITYLHAVSKSIEPSLLCPCNPQIFRPTWASPTPPVLN